MAIDRSKICGGILLGRKSRSLGLIALTVTFSASLGVNAALATCGTPSNQLTDTALSSALSLKTVCVGSSGNWSNQEYHTGTTGGSVIDYKKGSGDPIDPTTPVGTWAVGGSQVTYTYAAGGTYAYTVWQNGDSTLDFCNGAAPVVAGAKVISGQGPC